MASILDDFRRFCDVSFDWHSKSEEEATFLQSVIQSRQSEVVSGLSESESSDLVDMIVTHRLASKKDPQKPHFGCLKGGNSETDSIFLKSAEYPIIISYLQLSRLLKKNKHTAKLLKERRSHRLEFDILLTRLTNEHITQHTKEFLSFELILGLKTFIEEEETTKKILIEEETIASLFLATFESCTIEYEALSKHSLETFLIVLFKRAQPPASLLTNHIFAIRLLNFFKLNYSQAVQDSALKIIYKLVDFPLFQQRFIQNDGCQILLRFFGKKGHNYELYLKVFQKLTKNEDLMKDLKSKGALHFFLSILKRADDEETLKVTLKALSILLKDEELGTRFRDEGMETLLSLLVGNHESKNTELLVSLFQTLNTLCLFEKNKRVVKGAFPSTLLNAFLKVPHFSQEPKEYSEVVSIFQRLEGKDLDNMQTSLQNFSSVMGATSGFGKSLKKCNGYTFFEVIGRGAFGTVYKAQKYDQICAIKELNLEILEKKELKQSQEYISEVNVLKSMAHPNIVKFYEFFQMDRSLCIVMELFDGITLGEKIKLLKEKHQVYEEKEIWSIFLDLCSVLKYLHKDKKIIHRDINPSNILVNHQGLIKVSNPPLIFPHVYLALLNFIEHFYVGFSCIPG